MAERPKSSERLPSTLPPPAEERELRDYEKPTNRTPKREKESGVLSVEAASFMKNREGAVNEDAYFARLDADKKGGLFAVADGIGGHPGGDVASNTVVETVQKYAPEFEALRMKREEGDGTATLEAEETLLRQALREANARIVLKRQQYPDHFNRMGSTCTAVRLTRDEAENDQAIIGHVGDSRAYLLHPDDRLETLTLDDHLSLVLTKYRKGEEIAIAVQDILDQLSSDKEYQTYIELLEEGKSFSERSVVTEEQMRFLREHMEERDRVSYFHHRSRLHEALGGMPEVKTKIVTVPPGSRLMLATDATEGLRRDELKAVIRGNYDALDNIDVRAAASVWASNPAEAVALAARERGDQKDVHPKSKGSDDATVVMIEVPKR